MAQSARRRNPRMNLSFESLECRLAMSSGVAHASHSSGMVEAMAAKAREVKGSFSGHIQLIDTAHVVFSDMIGKVGKLKLTGHGFGYVSGNQFLGASLLLTGSGGTLTVDLYQAPIKNGANRTGSFKSVMLIGNATGSYQAAQGSAGSFVATINELKKWQVKTPSLMSDKIDVKSLSGVAFRTLEGTISQKL
jgi:hypothetical protein